MADRPGQHRELVFCYACDNEWHLDEHGLVCPQCRSDIVEIIDESSDPRDNRIDLTQDDDDEDVPETGATRSSQPNGSSHSPFHNLNPWALDDSDPEEADIERVTFSPAPGVRFETFRSSSPLRRRGPNANNPFGTLFQSLTTMMNEQAPGARTGGGGTFTAGPVHSTWQQGPRNHFTATARVIPSDNMNMMQSFEQIQAMMQAMITTMDPNAPGNNRPQGGNQRAMPDVTGFEALAQILNQMRDPANAAHGDAVYTEEAFDRILSQMMEQTGSSGAPGPASAAAIAALPKKPVDKSMMGSDGKAECSVCMDSVTIGDQVTVLPCKHWFHGDCVSAWLKEHDTCPHCRQGIMPKEGGDEASPRNPHQSPRHDQNAASPAPSGGPSPRFFFTRTPSEQQYNPPYRGQPPPPRAPAPGSFMQPGMQHPYVPGGYPAYPEPRNFISPSSQPPQVPPHPGMGPSFQPAAFVPPLQRHTQQDNGQAQTRTRRHSTSTRGSSHSSTGAGESSAGSRVAGWFRSLRGGANSNGSGGSNGAGNTGRSGSASGASSGYAHH